MRDLLMPAEQQTAPQDWFEAVKMGDLEAVSRFLSEGVPVDAGDQRNLPWDQTALMYAARHGHADLVRFLLRAGARVRARDRNLQESDGGHRPLHHAAAGGSVEAIAALLEGGADPNALTTGGNPPLNLAIRHNQLEAARFLLAHGASPVLSGGRKRPIAPLYVAADAELPGEALVTLVDLLLKVGADPNGRGPRGMTALHRLAWRKELHPAPLGPLLQMLLDAGADPNLGDDDGGTALESAVLYRLPNSVRVLASGGAELNRVYRRGTLLDIVIEDLDYFATRLAETTLPEPVREVVLGQMKDGQEVRDLLEALGAKREQDL